MTGKLTVQAHPLALDGPEVLVRVQGGGPAWSPEALARLGVRSLVSLKDGRIALLVREREQVKEVVLGLVAWALKRGLEVEVDPLAREELRWGPRFAPEEA
ncbi:hypothetical protein [Thermus sp. NMX2.A1]|uniref:hypothetical protein n=1 Tax=Thermus sp. NMX2.A1 TaxID=570924 RepID=UPI0003DCCE7B|nr:hypothetical protein [Thermus sp. NMX2.A1]ETN89093.1 hypothetical protein TNMX_03590 [Thermus sp. NMX2.A1]